MGLGGAFGLSPKLAKEYYPGFDATFGYGYKLSPTFSLLLDGEAVRSGSAEDSVTGGYNFTAGGLSLLAKLRFATKVEALSVRRAGNLYHQLQLYLAKG